MELKHYREKEICLNYIEAGAGRLLHFAHANGFPAGTYSPVIGALARSFRVLARNICRQGECSEPACPKERRIEGWHELAAELGDFLDAVRGAEKVIGVGHSIGGIVTLLCAVRRPELFERLVLLDPVLLEPKVVRLIRLMKLLGKEDRAPLAVRARKRRNGWVNREEALEFFRGRPLFDGWHEDSLRAYVEYGLTEAPDGGFVLTCPPEIEAQGFQTYPADIWRAVPRLRVPALFVRGGNSDTITHRARDLFRRLQPDVEYIELPGAGHLFPMQFPAETARIIAEYAATAVPAHQL